MYCARWLGLVGMWLALCDNRKLDAMLCSGSVVEQSVSAAASRMKERLEALAKLAESVMRRTVTLGVKEIIAIVESVSAQSRPTSNNSR